MHLKADLHIHSNHSDGKSSVREILEVAIDRRIDIVSITDHNTVNGSLEALEIVRDENLPIVILPGIEISTAQGHLLAFGVTQDVEAGIEMSEAVRIVRESGGITSLAHPFQFYRHGAVRLGCFKIVDCIEVFNAKSLGMFNRLSEFFCRRFGKGKTAGSDAHKAEFVGYGITVIELNDISLSGILNALKSGKSDVRGRTAMFEHILSKL
jgi:predicted metal-dependent phosphoesterase TrpH